MKESGGREDKMNNVRRRLAEKTILWLKRWERERERKKERKEHKIVKEENNITVCYNKNIWNR